MPGKYTRIVALLGLALPLLGTGCGVKVKQTTQLPPEQVRPLQTATLETLLGKLEEQATAITSINAVAELVPSTGSAYSGVIEQYHDVRVFVLAEQSFETEGNPDQEGTANPQLHRQVRLIGQAPIVRKDIFDMVADDSSFRIFLPSKNKFITGSTRLAKHSDKPIENLRPQHLFDALFFEAPRPDLPHLLEENEFGGARYYVVSEIAPREDGGLTLERKWWFERSRLDPVRVQRFESGGQLVSDVHYADWRTGQGAPFPGAIELVRPQEDYRLKLVIKELTLNQPLKETAFTLEQPQGVELVELRDDAPTGEKPQ